MNFIVFDLEFNQAYDEKNKDSTCPFEIIQIGAIKLDSELNQVSTFKSFVRPRIYTRFHPFVERLTSFKWDELIDAEPFDEVYQRFLNFIQDSNNIFCVWGKADIKELFRNINYYKLKYDNIPTQYINLQKYVSKIFNSPKSNSIGLKTALEFLKLPIHDEFHDAFNDAYYTAEIFKSIDIKSIKVQKYDPKELFIQKSNRNKSKRIIDKHGLIKQFEKMYKRKMTEEEKDIISLAYKMGLTGQFLLKKSDTRKST